VVGRKDGRDGQEAVVDVGALKKGMPKAIKLEKALADARTDASNFYKKFAKECGLNTAQLRNAAKAYANEDFEASSRKAEQSSSSRPSRCRSSSRSAKAVRGALVDRCDRCGALLVRMRQDQHAAMEAVYEDLAGQRDWPMGSGQMLDAWQWHQLVLFAFAKEQGWNPVLAPALDGGGLVLVMRQKQSRLTRGKAPSSSSSRRPGRRTTTWWCASGTRTGT
jgi:hypothetical protein